MPENPSVLMFIKGLDIGGKSGGAELFGSHLAIQLHKKGVNVGLCVCFKINSPEETNIVNSLKEMGVTPLFLVDQTNQNAVFGYAHAFIRLFRLLDHQQVDIIHSHFHTGTFLSLLLKLFRKSRWIVRTAHVDNEWKRGWSGVIKQSIIKSLIFIIFPLYVNQEFGVSSFAVKVLNERWLAKLINKCACLIPNAILISKDIELSARSNNNSGWCGDHPVIGSVGRLEEQKGYGYLLDALPKVLSKFPDLKVWLIGDGPLLDHLDAHSKKLGVQDHVIFWGKQKNVTDLLLKMDVFVSSSIYEGLPTAVLEAMQAGVPCIVTDVPGTRDLIEGSNTIVVPAQKSQPLAEAMIRLLDSPNLRKNIAENAMMKLDKFDIDKIATDYLNAYRKL